MKFYLMFLCLLNVSCQTTVEHTDDYSKRKTYMVYSTDIKADAINSCELSIVRKGDSLMQDILISSSDTAYAAELQAGTYSFETLTCGADFVDLKGKLRKFRVRKNRLNYLANLSVEKDSDGKLILKINSNNLQKVFALQTIAKSKKSLRFAYNGKKIKRSMVDADSSGKLKIKYRYKKTKPIINLSIKTCSLKSRAPVFIGHLDFFVEYQGFKMSKLRLESNYSNLDRKDIACIKEQLSNIQPQNNGSFELFVSYN